MKIYFDESGYTGEDLINGQQPLFVLASSNLGESESKAVVKDIFSTTKLSELK